MTKRERRLPAGLRFCEECGEVRGDARVDGGTIVSTCFCDGQICLECGKRRRRRPISDYYDPEDGQWWHVPWFIGHARGCLECRLAARGV